LEETIGLAPHTFSGGTEINHGNPSIRKTGLPFETPTTNSYHYSATISRPSYLNFGSAVVFDFVPNIDMFFCFQVKYYIGLYFDSPIDDFYFGI
jgi:hypothetical protein